jgi:hypothetical protein
MGAVFRSSRVVPLTESELEYLVDVVKHIFPDHVVLQFTIKNTIPEQVLKEAVVEVTLSDDSAWTQVRLGVTRMHAHTRCHSLCSPLPLSYTPQRLPFVSGGDDVRACRRSSFPRRWFAPAALARATWAIAATPTPASRLPRSRAS